MIQDNAGKLRYATDEEQELWNECSRLDALRTHKTRHDQARADADDWEESGYVFVSKRGTPLEPDNVVRHFKSVLRKAELPERVRFHDLRHSCATLLITQGIHLSVIKDILGHAQISTTADVYGHVFLETQRQATATLDALFGPSTAQATENDQPIQAAPAQNNEAIGEKEGVDAGKRQAPTLE